jgi:hypothetical protein
VECVVDHFAVFVMNFHGVIFFLRTSFEGEFRDAGFIQLAES